MIEKFQHVIVDGNNLFWRSFNKSLQKYITVTEHELLPGAIKESLTRIKHIENTFCYTDSTIYFCFDNHDSVISIRKLIDENYKSHRFTRQAPRGFYQTLKIFVELLKYYSDNYKIVSIDSLEADDLTKPIIDTLEISNRKKCLLISNDLDWARNLSFSENIYWWNFHKLYERKAFKEEHKFDCTFEKIQLYKSIHGDDSDRINNAVPGLREEILIDILNTFNNVDELYKGLWNTKYPEKWKLKLKEAEREVRKNLCLVDFIPIELDIKEYIVEGKRSIEALKYYYDSLQLDYEGFMGKKKLQMFEKTSYNRI